jgi:hypothetical protein
MKAPIPGNQIPSTAARAGARGRFPGAHAMTARARVRLYRALAERPVFRERLSALWQVDELQRCPRIVLKSCTW